MGTHHQRGRENPLDDKRKENQRARQAAVALLVLGVTFPLAGLPANAAVTEITPPHTVEVLPGLDIAAAGGYDEDIVMEVWRDGLKIGSTGAPQPSGLVIPDADDIALPMTKMLEVNHDGGTCWAGNTPDIIAGDEIRVITEDGADPVGERMTVADISVNEPKIADLDADGAFNDVVMTGSARNPDGSALDISNPATVSAEIVQPALRDIGIPNWAPRAMRADATGVQLDGNTVFPEGGFGTLTVDPDKGAPYWVATWKNLPEIPEGVDRPSVPQLALDGEHNFAVAAGPGDEDTGGLGTTIAQPGDASGPAQGCPVAGDDDAVKGASPTNVNIAAASDVDNLTISGTSFNANAVHVSLDDSDGDPSDAIMVEATVNKQALLDETASPVEPVKQTWQATVPMDQITSGLDDGELTASGVFDRVIETKEERQVPATNADGTPVLEPAFNADGSPVAADDASLYRDATGPAQATDETGAPMFGTDGTTPVYTRQVLRTETFYTHTVSPRTGGTHALLKDLEAPAAPTANLEDGRYIGTQWLTLHADNEVEETVRYRMGDAGVTDPGLASPAVTSQLALSHTQTVKARSVDRAGNLGPVFTGTYTVTAPLAPGAPTALVVTEGDSEVAVSWSAPDNDGGAPITAYRVRADNGRTTPLVADVEDGLSTTLTGLTPGETYTVQVAAVNEAGRGAWSEPSSVTLPAPAPPEPTDRVAPLLTSQLPAAGASSVSARNNLLVSFNEPVTGVSAANLQLRNTATNSVVPASVTYDAATQSAQLNPQARLAPGVRFTAVLQGLTDQAGNPMDARRWSFTTDPAPRIALRSPAPGARAVARLRNLRIQVSERITGVSNRSVQLRRASNGTRVAALVRYNRRSETIVVNPRQKLGSRTAYTVTLTRALKDGDRYALPRTKWRFRTR